MRLRGDFGGTLRAAFPQQVGPGGTPPRLRAHLQFRPVLVLEGAEVAGLS